MHAHVLYVGRYGTACMQRIIFCCCMPCMAASIGSLEVPKICRRRSGGHFLGAACCVVAFVGGNF